MAVGGGTITTLTTTSDITVQGVTVGRGAGAVATNTAVGASALAANTSGVENIAVGYQAGYGTTSGSYNTTVGSAALYTNTTGQQNSVFGRETMKLNTTGSYNSAFGFSSLLANTTGANNTAIGYLALTANTTASNNTAVGYQAGYTNSTGASNVSMGYQAGYYSVGSNNVFVGTSAGLNTTTAYNTLVGFGAGYLITSGAKNTILGGYNGNQGGLDIRTASNYIVLSDGDGNPRGVFNDSGYLKASNNGTYASIYGAWHELRTSANLYIGIFQNTSSSLTQTTNGLVVEYTAASPNSTSQYLLYCGDSTTLRAGFRSNGGLANYSANDVNLSDRREKTNFAPAGSYLDKICAIPVQTFNYIDQNLETDGGLTLGVVAQDVQAVAPELVMESNWAKHDEEPKMRLSIYQTDFQYALMKCIQELKAEVDSLKAQINGASA
jgi:hypothetical protein